MTDKERAVIEAARMSAAWAEAVAIMAPELGGLLKSLWSLQGAIAALDADKPVIQKEASND